MREDNPYMIERIVASLSYLTMGFVGFIWLILGLFTGAKLRKFVQYHIFQSIFISIAYVLLSMAVGFMSDILSIIPFVNKVVAQITFLFNMPFIFNYSMLQMCMYTFLSYLTITSFMGKYSYVPFVSDIIDQNIGR